MNIVLAGIGHTNAHVVREWRFAPIPGARLTCVAPFPFATYSGMLPGVLAGLYQPAQMRIDLRDLCDRAGARFVAAEIVGGDTARRRLDLSDGTQLEYDVLSVGVGSVARLPPRIPPRSLVPSPLAPIKPMQTFLERLDARLEQLANRGPRTTDAPPWRAVVVGGGAGGTEIALALGRRLADRLGPERFEVSLACGETHAASGLAGWTRRMLAEELERRRVRVVVGRRVVEVDESRIVDDRGEELPADLVVWAADAVAPPLLKGLDLPTDERGFLRTNHSLQSLGAADVFAVGDSGSIDGERLPKAGVYAVRQGPILWENLRRIAAGRPLVTYRPQRTFLKLLSLGDGRAIGEYRGVAFRGAWVWRWKDRIDRGFMSRYQT